MNRSLVRMNGRALLAWNLRRLRSEKGISQERLAADTGVDRAYVSEIEREQGNATVDLLDRLASALDVDLMNLFLIPEEGELPPVAMRPGRKSKNA